MGKFSKSRSQRKREELEENATSRCKAAGEMRKNARENRNGKSSIRVDILIDFFVE